MEALTGPWACLGEMAMARLQQVLATVEWVMHADPRGERGGANETYVVEFEPRMGATRFTAQLYYPRDHAPVRPDQWKRSQAVWKPLEKVFCAEGEVHPWRVVQSVFDRRSGTTEVCFEVVPIEQAQADYNERLAKEAAAKQRRD